MGKNDSLRDSVVTITGGTGSFGSNMTKHLLARNVSEIRIFSRDEAKQDALRHEISDSRVRFFIGDTRDQKSVDRVTRGTDLIFHAAALKQVPSAEFFPLEAVKTNIKGSANVLRSAVSHGVKSVVCLSTDKAVYPINTMGMTKALMERTAQAVAREALDSETTISITRYGNVMYSRGSVIPLFISQIRSKNEVTVTDPRMTRFLMSLSESIDLVEYAFDNAQAGDLFVKKAPASDIDTLAKALIELFGNSRTTIKVMGFRHGEKLHETLLGSEESARTEDRGEFFRVKMDSRDLNYSAFFEEGSGLELDFQPYSSQNTVQLSVDETKAKLLSLPQIREQLGK